MEDNDWGYDEDGNFRLMNQPDISIDQPNEAWTDKEWNTFAEWIKGVLRSGKVTLTFTKKDGSLRVMQCTLNPDILPKVEIKEDRPERKKPENTIAVYDLEANGWRSFTINSVKRVQFTIN